MKTRLTGLVALLFLWVGARSQSQETQRSFTLEEARAYAVKHSYSTRQAAMDEEIAKKKVKETTAIGLPQVSASAEFQNFLDIPTQVIPNFINASMPNPDPNAPEFIEAQFGTDYNISAGVSASQLIFDGSYIVGLQASKAYKDLSIKQRIKTEQQIQNDVTNAYALVLVSEENVKVLQANLENLDTLLLETEQLYQEGFTEEESVDQLRLISSSIKNQVNNAKRQQIIARNMLKFQMGIPVADQIELKQSLNEILTVNSQENLLNSSLDINAHIDYQLALNNEALKGLTLKNNKAGFLPRLSAFYNYQQSYLNNEFDVSNGDYWFPTNLWGLKLEVPIFTSFMKVYQVQQATIELEKAELQTQQASEALQLGVLRAKADYDQALGNYTVKEGNYELATKIYKKEQIKYKEGVSSSMDFTQAQNQMLQEQANYLMSIYQLVETKTALDNALNNYNK